MAGTLLWCDACRNGMVMDVLETESALCYLNRGRDLQARDHWNSARQGEPCHLERKNTRPFLTSSRPPLSFPTGGDLFSAIRRHPDLMKWDRLGKRVAKDVALGLHYLHTRKVPVLHRDLKSPNILLTGRGPGCGKLPSGIFLKEPFQVLVIAVGTSFVSTAAAALCSSCIWQSSP